MIKGEKIKRNVGRRIVRECHLLDMRTVRLSLTMVGTTDEETTETMLVQAGRGLVVVKLLHLQVKLSSYVSLLVYYTIA